jgi:ATP phosphoribosyltransferase
MIDIAPSHTAATGERLRLALQKSGRLSEDSLALLKNCGLHVKRSKDQLFCRVEELPIDLLLIRDDDIPQFVHQGICDIGIVGEDVFLETRLSADESFTVTTARRLGFSKCRLAIAMPETTPFQTLADLNGKRIATSFPACLQNWLKDQNVKAEAVLMTGSVEVAPRLKIADAICDLVASGATLAANNLREVATVLNSEALLIRPSAPLSPDKEAILDRLMSRMKGALTASDSKYIMLHAPRDRLPEVVKLLPGVETPTILPLQGDDVRVAVHAVCREQVFWDTMERLKAAGASAILILPIEKMLD